MITTEHSSFRFVLVEQVPVAIYGWLARTWPGFLTTHLWFNYDATSGWWQCRCGAVWVYNTNQPDIDSIGVFRDLHLAVEVARMLVQEEEKRVA